MFKEAESRPDKIESTCSKILELFCHFGVLWFESKLLATGSSGWTVAKCNVVKMESALFGYFSHLDYYLLCSLSNTFAPKCRDSSIAVKGTFSHHSCILVVVNLLAVFI